MDQDTKEKLIGAFFGGIVLWLPVAMLIGLSNGPSPVSFAWAFVIAALIAFVLTSFDVERRKRKK